MFGAIQDKLLLLLVPIIVAPMAMYATQASKKAWAWLDRQHPVIKQGVVVAYAALFNALVAIVGKDICVGAATTCDITGLDWKVILTYAIATSLHSWRKSTRSQG